LRRVEALAKTIAQANVALFEKLFGAFGGDNNFSPDAASAGRRALRNVVLDYLSAGSGDPARASAEFAAATNMTDRSAALRHLAQRHPDSLETTQALAAFEERYRTDPLVLDKWFQIQASIPGAQSVERVEALMRHPAFRSPTPTASVRWSAPSRPQPDRLHRADGGGYQLFTDTVLALEKRNPQVAARLATALRSWRSLEPVRQEKARQALLRLAGAEGLSADLRDIVERTLA